MKYECRQLSRFLLLVMTKYQELSFSHPLDVTADNSLVFQGDCWRPVFLAYSHSLANSGMKRGYATITGQRNLIKIQDQWSNYSLGLTCGSESVEVAEFILASLLNSFFCPIWLEFAGPSPKGIVQPQPRECMCAPKRLDWLVAGLLQGRNFNGGLCLLLRQLDSHGGQDGILSTISSLLIYLLDLSFDLQVRTSGAKTKGSACLQLRKGKPQRKWFPTGVRMEWTHLHCLYCRGLQLKSL